MHKLQQVVVGGDHLDWVLVQSDVPQGTVLDPVLFLLYINDLPDNITSNVRLFAYIPDYNDLDALIGSLNGKLNLIQKNVLY